MRRGTWRCSRRPGSSRSARRRPGSGPRRRPTGPGPSDAGDHPASPHSPGAQRGRNIPPSPPAQTRSAGARTVDGAGRGALHRGLVPCWDPPPLWVGLCQPETFGQAPDPWEECRPLDQSSRRPSVPADQIRAGGGREHDDPHRPDAGVGGAAAVPVRQRVRRSVPVRDAAVLVPAAHLDDRLRLRGARAAGGQLPRPVRRAGPPRRLLRAGLDPRVRALRRRDRARRRGRHRDHRRPRGPQDPRGARRPPGPRRRPDQEPGRPALPGPDAGHRPVRHLRADLRRLRRHPRHRRQPRAARVRSSPPSSTTPRPRTCGARWSRPPCSGRSSRSSAVTRG